MLEWQGSRINAFLMAFRHCWYSVRTGRNKPMAKLKNSLAFAASWD